MIIETPMVMRTLQEFASDSSRVRFDSAVSILISVMLSSQMIIAGARHSPYSSKTPPPPSPHKDSDSLSFTSNALITEIRMFYHSE